MATEELKDFVEERLRAFDPDIDLTDGSPAQDQVVDPVVRRFQPDPFEMDVEAFLSARLQQEFPDMNIREGSGLRDLLVKPNQILMDPISREVQLIKQGQSLANPELLAPSEADALVANLFVTRQTGGLSTGTVRMFFNAPVAINISVGNVCFTSEGLRFLPTTLQSISAEAMLFNQSGSLFYFDIQVTAEDTGSEYNVKKGDIVGITNLNAAVRVDNLEDFEDGLDEESTDELVQRAETSITERSLVVARGVSARLTEQFDDLQHLQIVGMLDVGMERDILTGGDLGPVLLSGNGGFTTDDDDGDANTLLFQERNAPFTTFFGAPGVVENYWLTYSELITVYQAPITGEVLSGDLTHFKIGVFGSDRTHFEATDIGLHIITSATNAANQGVAKIVAIVDDQTAKLDRVGVVETGIGYVFWRPSKDVEIEEVLTSGELKLKSTISANMEFASWTIRKKEITISGIPGGILFTDDAAAIAIQSDEVHIGGATDFYVRGTGVSESELDIASISDETPLTSADSGSSDNSTVEKSEFFQDTSADFVALGAAVGMSLIVETGVDAGTKTILAVGVAPGGASVTTYLQVTPAFTSVAAGLRYKIIDDIDISLNEPRTIRDMGEDVQTLQLSDVVTTAAAIDFLSVGAEVGDTLELLEGNDKGKYSVQAIGGVGNKNLQISAQLTSTSNNIAWELYKAQDGLDLPLVRITSIDLLDSSNQPTGDTIPYADPVDARTSAFSNAGLGTKVSTTDAITGIVGTVDLDGAIYPLGTVVLSVAVNDAVDVDITLTGATSKTDLLDTINTAIFNIAGTLAIDGESRLTLRSGDRWLRVEPEAASAGTGYAAIGLDPLGEDNRQIKSAGNISDWTSSAYDLKVEKDVVSLTEGGNIGHLYLVAVESSPNRLIVLDFDETTGRARFLEPGTGISLSAGSRSYGKARVYFLDPTSFEARGNWRPPLKNTTTFPANVAIAAAGGAAGAIASDEPARTAFTATINGTELRFFPDPDLSYQVAPAPTADVPNNLKTVSGDNTVVTEASGDPTLDLGKNSRDADADFLSDEVLAGDLLEITFQPIQGTVDMVPFTFGAGGTLDGLTFILSIDGAPFKTLTFSDQLAAVDDIKAEINALFGETVAFTETIGAFKYLRLEADFEIIIRKDGTSNSVLSAGWTAANVVNQAVADVDGFYRITTVGEPAGGDRSNHGSLELVKVSDGAAPTANGQSQHYRIVRPGLQRIHSTDMNDNAEIGLHYVDIELVSEGSGNEWNLDADVVMVVTGHASDGYRLLVVDPNLSYSEEEELLLEISRRMLTVGATDKPSSATQLFSQNIQVNYDRSPLAAQVQSFSNSELERVLNASIIVRHLQPHYLSFDVTYRGGSSADIVRQDILDYLDALGPTERVESSDIQNVVLRRSATFVENPITLVAVVHDEERKITVERSTNFVTKGDLATFFDDDIVVTREDVSSL